MIQTKQLSEKELLNRKFNLSQDRQPHIYIASPYSIGNKEENVNRQIDMADFLMDLGFAPYLPLLNHFQGKRKPRIEQDWLNLDLQWMRTCDATIRLKPIINGKELPSLGADIEEAECNRLNIPIFYNVRDLCIHFKKTKEYQAYFQDVPDNIIQYC